MNMYCKIIFELLGPIGIVLIAILILYLLYKWHRRSDEAIAQKSVNLKTRNTAQTLTTNVSKRETSRV